MGLAAACTSGTDEGSTSGTQFNLWIGNDIDGDGVGDPGATSGELGFDVDRVDYRITCNGNPPGSYPIPPGDTNGNAFVYDDSVDITGQFEVVDGRDPPIWQMVEDLPPQENGGTNCTISLWVYDGDDLVCSGTQTLGIVEDNPGNINKYDIVLVCSLSIDTPDASADVDGSFDFITGNVCPKIYTLNAIHTEVDPATGLTEIQFRAKDPDDDCGNNCDPCIPDFSTNPPTCPAPPHQGLVCTLSAPGGTFVLKEDIPNPPLPAGTPVGNVLPINLNTVAGVPGVIIPGVDILYQCDVSTPGTTTIRVDCTDGDLECDKTQPYDIVCPGANLCDGSAACSINADCGAQGTCTGGFCEAVVCTAPVCNTPGTCNAADGLCSASTPDTGGSCQTGTGAPGTCNNGTCEATGCSTNADCATTSPCTDAACNTGTGICGAEFPVNDNGSCTNAVGGPGICNAGTCDPAPGACTNNADCDTGNDCTDSTCTLATGVCTPPADANEGGACTAANGQTGQCLAGTCALLFAGTGEFRAYNNLLPAEGQPATCGGQVPAGPAVGTCTVPSLCTVPGANPPSSICTPCTTPGSPNQTECGVFDPGTGSVPVLCDTDSFCAPPTSIDVFCIESFPGTAFTFDDDGAGSVSMTGEIALLFAINTAINLAGDCSLIVPVLIETNSLTELSGSGTGSVSPGGSLVLDQLPPPDDAYNVENVNVTGQVLCDAGAFSATICPLAGLAPGINPVPLPSDNSLRQYPQINFGGSVGNLTWQTGAGPSDPSGWFVNNAAGDQFLTLGGSQ
jgi:hypothetical protein